MSTNYYFKKPPYAPRHIGKCWSLGGGQCAFTWTIDPAEFQQLVESQPLLTVLDEYDREVPIAEFNETVISDCSEYRTDLIGQIFS